MTYKSHVAFTLSPIKDNYDFVVNGNLYYVAHRCIVVELLN